MLKGFFNVPTPVNEPVKAYAPGSTERKELQKALKDARAKQVDVPMYIGSDEVRTRKTRPMSPPHDHQHILGQFHEGAINDAMVPKDACENMALDHRAAIFMKAADLLAGPYRARINSATMLAQSKNAMQAEIDAACELIDFLRFNVKYMTEIYAQQPPISGNGVWNRVEQRPLEGFVFALTPFNFTAIAGNLRHQQP